MMRNKTSSSLQKTYDECYLICSTAVYFEGQVCLVQFVSWGGWRALGVVKWWAEADMGVG